MQKPMSLTLSNEPVGNAVRPVEPVPTGASLRSALLWMRANGTTLAPIADNGIFIGAVREADIAAAIADGRDLNEPIDSIETTEQPVIPLFHSQAEALRRLVDAGESEIVVIDTNGVFLGFASLRDFVLPTRSLLRPRPIGGMATPFGVYLTNGTVRGGVPMSALVATGGLLFFLFFLANLAGIGLTNILDRCGYAWLPNWGETVIGGLSLFIFMFSIRALPLSGIHAAEHMVVHAIEREEDLTPGVVKRMPRVHPRCGTNIAAAATMFFGILGATWIPEGLREFLAIFLTLILWRPLGSLLQYWVTTRPPNAKQIQMGIDAGDTLLENYRRAPYTHASPWQRIWNSGFLQIVTGSIGMSILVEAVLYLLGLQYLLPVY